MAFLSKASVESALLEQLGELEYSIHARRSSALMDIDQSARVTMKTSSRNDSKTLSHV